MAKARALEERLAALSELRSDPTSSTAIEKLRKALASKVSHLVAKAAQIVGESEIDQLIPELVDAFDRFMTHPTKSDKGCGAKAAIAHALYQVGYDREGVYLRGIHHVQMEPVYGGSVDTAAVLRGSSALGLVRMNYPQVIIELAHLLADDQATARVAATRAIAYAQRAEEGVPLLRFKILGGDEDSQVLCECFEALLKLAPSSSLPFVAKYLDHRDPEMSEAAVMALGQSRLKDAFDILKRWWQESSDPVLRRTALTAIAMLRHEAAIEFLLSLVAGDSESVAGDALTALAMYRHDEGLRRRVEQTADRRDDIDLGPPIARAFV